MKLLKYFFISFVLCSQLAYAGACVDQCTKSCIAQADGNSASAAQCSSNCTKACEAGKMA